jgi:hypothetical protein
VVRRLFSRGSQPYRASPPTIEAWSKDGEVEITVRNNDSATADSPHLVLMLASGETSEYERVEVDLESIDPSDRAVATIPTTRKSVFRAWWFLTWEARGASQQASGNVDIA